MTYALFIGMILVIVAGLGTGTIAWPVKRIRKFHFEHFLFVSMFTGLIIVPWSVFLLKVPSAGAIIQSVGVKPLIIANLLSVSWGVANILYLVCVIHIGAAITGATLSALGMSVGVLMPMLIKGSGLFAHAPDLLSPAGGIILTGLLVMIIGIVLTTKAGLAREKVIKDEQTRREDITYKGGFLKGLLLAAIAGILSSGISLAFVYGQSPVASAVEAVGGSPVIQSFSVWALAIAGGGLVNVGYAFYLMVKRRTLKTFFASRSEILYGAIVGIQFIFSIVLMGKGMLLLGALGASVGFAIQQSTQIIGNQLVGFWGGEWKGINGKPRRLMYAALITILIAIGVIAYSNTYTTF